MNEFVTLQINLCEWFMRVTCIIKYTLLSWDYALWGINCCNLIDPYVSHLCTLSGEWYNVCFTSQHIISVNRFELEILTLPAMIITQSQNTPQNKTSLLLQWFTPWHQPAQMSTPYLFPLLESDDGPYKHPGCVVVIFGIFFTQLYYQIRKTGVWQVHSKGFVSLYWMTWVKSCILQELLPYHFGYTLQTIYIINKLLTLIRSDIYIAHNYAEDTTHPGTLLIITADASNA